MIIPPPTSNEVEAPELPTGGKTWEWYQWYFDVPSWTHSKCGAVNFGRNKYCAYCFGKYGIKVGES